MKPRKILITDADNCALEFSESKKFLSVFLLQEAKKYDGFVICTHRTSDFFLPNEDGKIRMKDDFNDANAVIKHHHLKETHPSDVFLSRVVENLKEETGVKCIAVSTPYDTTPELSDTREYRECGWGYTNIIKPIEDKLIKSLKEEKEIDVFTHVLDQEDVQKLLKKDITYFSPYTKNNQIKKILKKLHKTYPKDKLEVAFIDDLDYICKSALRLSWDEIHKIAPNVTQFSVYNHDAFESLTRAKEKDPILLLGTVTPAPSIFQRCFSCFSPARKKPPLSSPGTNSISLKNT